MTRFVIPWMCLVLAVAVVGCTKSPPSPSKTPPSVQERAPVAPPADETPPQTPATEPATPPEAKPATPDATPATPDVQPATDAASNAAAPGQPDMTPPAEVTPTPPAQKLPFEDLVALLGNDMANQRYRQIEEQLAQTPQELMPRLQLASLLNAVGMNLARSGNQEKATEAMVAALEQVKLIQNPPDAMTRLQLASVMNSIGMGFANAGNQEKVIETFLAALEQAKAVTADPQQTLPEGADQMLAMVFYNGACAQSLSGKPDEAKATLQTSVEMGYTDLDSLRNDADLAAVRALPDFEQQITAWQTVIAERLVKEAQKVLAAGETFPFDFSLTDLSGQSINRAGYLGKVLIVDIWGTWCPPCRAEIPSFVRLQTEYGPQGLQIVGLNYENADNDEAAKELITKFMQENGMNYPCAIGTKEIQAQVPEFRGYPTTMFIDRTGKVRAKVVGSHDYAFLEAIVKILLAEAAPADAPPAAPAETPPAAPAETPPAAPAETPPADAGTPPATPPADAPAEPGK